MSALFEFSHETLSKKPRYRRKREYVEGELFSESLTITNAEDRTFPPAEMLIRIRTEYATGQMNVWEIPFRIGSLGPGKSFQAQTDRNVLASGFALFKLEAHGYSGDEFHDAKGRPIPLLPSAFDNFHATSTMELATLAGLYFAAAGTILAAVAVILTVLLR